MKKFIKKLVAVSFVFALLFNISVVSKADATDVGEYECRFEKMKNGDKITVGNYDFTMKNSKIYISGGGLEKTVTPLENDSITGRNDAYYVTNTTLKKYVFGTGESSDVAVLPSGKGDNDYTLGFCHNGKLIMTRSSFDRWEFLTVTYDLTSAAVTAHMKGYISEMNGDYCIVDMNYRTDVSPGRYDLYKMNGNGFKKIKTLEKNCYVANFVGGYIYYTGYNKGKMNNVTIYRCKKNGKGKKKIGTIRKKGSGNEIFASGFTKTYCKVKIGTKNYKYIYKTKKLKKA